MRLRSSSVVVSDDCWISSLVAATEVATTSLYRG